MIMAAQSTWSCRDTIQCNDTSQYSARKAGKKSCWETVQEVDAFSYNVCCDCLVYVACQKNSILSKSEIQDILTFKGIDTLDGNHCQQFTNAVDR